MTDGAAPDVAMQRGRGGSHGFFEGPRLRERPFVRFMDACGLKLYDLMRFLVFALAVVWRVAGWGPEVQAHALVADDTTRASTRVSETTTPLPDSLKRWQADVALAFNGTQASYTNWTAGGVNALAGTVKVTTKVTRTYQYFAQIHDVGFTFGMVKQDTLALRKALDEIRYAFSLEYRGGGAVRPTVGLEVRSQVAAGYEYNASRTLPNGVVLPFLPDNSRKISDAFAPAVFSQVLGLSYTRSPRLKLRLGVGMKETYIDIPRVRPLYGNAVDQAIRFEGGPDMRVESSLNLAEHVTWTSRLGAFYSVEAPDEAPDTDWEHTIRMKFNSWLSLNLDGVARYDADQSRRLQFRQGVGLGVSLSLL